MATPDTPIEALMQRWAITRNAVKKRARTLGVELLRPDAHTALWPGEALELAERFHAHLQAGQPARTFPELPRDPEAALVPKPVAAPAARPVPTLVTQPEQLATLVAALLPALVPAVRPTEPPDPLAVPEALARAAERGHWLSTAELAAVMQRSPATVRAWGDGYSPRPGYWLERHPDRDGWWRVVAD